MIKVRWQQKERREMEVKLLDGSYMTIGEVNGELCQVNEQMAAENEADYEFNNQGYVKEEVSNIKGLLVTSYRKVTDGYTSNIDFIHEAQVVNHYIHSKSGRTFPLVAPGEVLQVIKRKKEELGWN